MKGGSNINALIFDVETTIANKGNPFNRDNWMVVAGFRDSRGSQILYHDDPNFEIIQTNLNSFSFYVGFNIKFDIHWLRQSGFKVNKDARIWDCQIAEFLFSDQQNAYPSLNESLQRFGLPQKLDVVKEEYWDKGIDTPDIPRPVLTEYLEQDLEVTYLLYQKQLEYFKNVCPHKYPLFRLMCADLLVLEEMEYNGVLFNVGKAEEEAKRVDMDIERVYSEIEPYFNGVPVNLGSPDQLSCLLYGGDIVVESRIPVGVYKTGAKVGQPRYKILKTVYNMPRLFTPIEGTETAKEGYWSTEEKVLRSLKGSKKHKHFLTLITEYSELNKLNSTYLRGYPKLIETMNWKPNMLHGNLNQCVVITGRLSSTKPNLQNADPITKKFMESRYGRPV